MKLAVFDFDGTVLRGNTWHRFFREELRAQPGRAPWLLTALAVRRTRLASAEWLQNQVLVSWRGRSRHELADVSLRFYASQLRPRLRVEALKEMAQRRAEGCELVLVSAAWDMLLEPFAAEFGLVHWTGTPVAFANGVCTGRLATPLLRGEAKCAWLRSAFGGRPVDWPASLAFGDEALDVPMLAMVGSPYFVVTKGKAPDGLPAGTRVLTWM